jgi:hypothetical protein
VKSTTMRLSNDETGRRKAGFPAEDSIGLSPTVEESLRFSPTEPCPDSTPTAFVCPSLNFIARTGGTCTPCASAQHFSAKGALAQSRAKVAHLSSMSPFPACRPFQPVAHGVADPPYRDPVPSKKNGREHDRSRSADNHTAHLSTHPTEWSIRPS